MVAEDGDGLLFIELVEGAGGDFAHGNESAAGDLRGLELPGLAHVEEERRVVGGELLFELVDGDLEVHELRIKGGAFGEARTFLGPRRFECCQTVAKCECARLDG